MIISKKGRDQYKIEEFINYDDLIAVFEDYYSAKVFAEKVNKQRETELGTAIPEKYVRASVINALGVLDEAYLSVIDEYFKENGENLREELLETIKTELGENKYLSTLKRFAEVYPSKDLYAAKVTFDEYINNKTNGIDNEILIIDEVILAYLTYNNKAIDEKAYGDFFDGEKLNEDEDFIELFSVINNFFEEKPLFPTDSQTTLLEYVEKPFIEEKNIESQLKYIQTSWSKYLSPKQLGKILSAIAYLLEENDLIWHMFHPGGSYSPVLTYNLGEFEAFSEDRDWMPNVVMIAKSTYVWLDQLSKKYQTYIQRLDQIPNEELILIRNRGINAIWLIGLWERSKASKTLKHIMGNPEAEASAYSIKDYSISYDLGGYLSYENLRDRCRSFGIRLASDMVPNHFGLDAHIVYDRPDFFISLNHSPYPSYSFNGNNYSENPDIGIYIDDHYYNHSDAAVVFKYVNFRTGETRFIYHGNDGTSIPWNDTAQLDFLKAEVRNWVIQNILHVARMFPIIRFDAAMTLAKAQFQRLWYPEPGTPGGVASRSSYTVSSELFNQMFPNEFWREVVDTVAEKVPDTLLLAEAFWMLEGYFVRTLGMHRVYNSAFMNMLKNELNDQYRSTIKNTIEFDPEILKRFVNFMNNPDEQTAVAQFGKGDKYFGVLLMMATMPGLPMIGHGQIEGFTEKYGMEFKKAYWNEQEDFDLIRRHEAEIFPLFHKRWLFSDVRYFRLFDFYRGNGSVDENVFAFTNGTKDKRAFIIYHNKYAETSGWIKTSARYLNRWSEDREFLQENLANSLLLTNKPSYFVIFKDYKTNLEFIRKSTEVFDRGMYFILGAYQYHIFMDFYEVKDADNLYLQVHDFLNGNGTKNIHETMLDLELRGIQTKCEQLLDKDLFISMRTRNFTSFFNQFQQFLDEINHKESLKYDIISITKDLNRLLDLSFSRDKLESIIVSITNRENFSNNEFEMLKNELIKGDPVLFVVNALLFIGDDMQTNSVSFNEKSFLYIEKWRLKKDIYAFFKSLNFTDEKADEGLLLTLILIKYFSLPEETFPSNFVYYVLYDLLNDPLIADYLKINLYNGEYWYNKERFTLLMTYLIFVIALYDKPDLNLKLIPKILVIIDTSEKSDYKINQLRKLFQKSESKKIIKPFKEDSLTLNRKSR